MTSPVSTMRDEYTTQMKLQLDELNTKIDSLETKAFEATQQAREQYHAEMLKLRDQSKAARAQLDQMVAAGEDSWDKMVAEMEKVRDAFVHSFSYFKSQL